MKTKLSLTHATRTSVSTATWAVLAAFTLFFSAARAPAQTGWGNALWLNGTNAFVRADAIPLANASFTTEAWARRETTGTMDMIVAQGSGNPHIGLLFGFHWDWVGFVFDFYGDGVTTFNIDNAWHHWAGTYDAATRIQCLYRDGILLATNVANQNYQGSGPLYIGAVPYDDPANFGGVIDEVRIWNVARSAAEIRQCMNQRLTGRETHLVAYWKFDEGGGDTARDSTANGHNGTLVNSPQWTPSSLPWLNALSFDGVNDYLSASIPQLASNYTFSAWVFLRAGGTLTGVRQAVLSITHCGDSAEVLIRSQTSSAADPQYLELGRCGAFTGTPSTLTVPTNQWAHVAVTVSSNMQVSYFINGVAAGSWDGSGRPLTIGPGINLGDNSARRFNGVLEDVRIWNTARTQAEIQEDMCHPLSGTESNLVAYFRFDEGSGTVAADATDNHHDGTLNNGPAWTNSTIPPFINLNLGLPGVQRSSVAWGDYDNDGRLDFLLTGQDANSSQITQLWRNTGSGFTNVTDTVAPGLPGLSYSSVAWGDYDHDGRLDMLLTGGSATGAVAEVWHNNLEGTFSDINARLPSVSYCSAAWGDYDGDGRLDILLTGYHGGFSGLAQVWQYTGTDFTNVTDIVAPGLPAVGESSAAWGDYDNDGHLDILLTGTPNGTSSGAIAQVWRNIGNGTFANLQAGLPGLWRSSVAWGDYDNDEQLDILLTGQDINAVQTAQIWRNTGTGFTNVTETVAPGLPGVFLGAVAWGDYDNDGRSDILLTGATGGYPNYYPIAQLWHNTGSGFTTFSTGLPGVAMGSVAWGDYDHDGRVDLLLTGTTDGSASGALAQLWRNIAAVPNTLTPATPVITQTMLAGNNLVFTGTGGTEGATYYVLSSTDATASMANWPRLATNTFGVGGRFTVTNTLDTSRPRQFFRLQVP